MSYFARLWGLESQAMYDPEVGSWSYRSYIWRPGGRTDVLSDGVQYRPRDAWKLRRFDLARDLDLVATWATHGAGAFA